MQPFGAGRREGMIVLTRGYLYSRAVNPSLTAISSITTNHPVRFCVTCILFLTQERDKTRYSPIENNGLFTNLTQPTTKNKGRQSQDYKEHCSQNQNQELSDVFV